MTDPLASTLASEDLPGPPAPLLARLTAPAGAPRARRLRRAGAEVVALPGRYCVSYLLLAEHAVAIVDVGSTSDAARLLALLPRLGRSPAEVRFILPTHLHFDHCLGIDALACRLDAPVALGAVAAAHVGEGQPLRWPRRRHLLRAVPTWAFQGLPLPPLGDLRQARRFGFPWSRNRFVARPGPVLAHGDELPGLPGWVCLATPGHADDAICLHHAAAGFLVAGDTARNFLGGEWNPLLCSPEDYARTRALLTALPVETIFPAHGPLIEGPRAVARLRQLPAYLP